MRVNALITTLVLSLLITDDSIEKWGYKQDIIELSNFCYNKVVFASLTKVIIVHV